MTIGAALVASGCRKDPPPAPPPPAVNGANATTRATGKTLRIAMIAKSSSNPSFLSARTGAEDRARDLSAQVGAPIEIDWLTPSQEDAQVQAQRIQQAVNERVDAILISCSDDQKVSDAINDAVARGVEVMTFDSDAPRSRRFAHAGVDDFDLGQKVMRDLAGILAAAPAASKVGANAAAKGPARGPVKVAILAGNPVAPNLRRRVEGAMAEAARHATALKVVGTFFHVETAQDSSAEVLRVTTTHPDLAGWAMLGGWPLYNKTLLSDLDAAESKLRFKIVAVNALPPELIYVEKGYAPVLLAQPTYLWGAVGVEAIVNKLLLKKPVPEHIPMDLIRVTFENLGTWARQLKAWGFGDVPDEYLRRK